MGKLSEDFCTWILEEPGDSYTWVTDCDEAIFFESDGPEENGFKYCPFCGKPIIPEGV